MPKHIFSLALLVTTLATPLVHAQAADLDPGYAEIPPLQETKVEFGSGWYIRGDIGATRLPALQANTPSVLPTSTDFNPPLAANATLSGSSRLGYDASLGAGYEFNRWFRADIVADFHQPLTANSTSGNGNVFCPTAVSYPDETTSPTGQITYGTPSYASGGCTGNYQAHLTSYDVLINGYVDLGTWYRVTPYVGAGAGLSFGHYQTSASYVQANGQPYQVSFTDPAYGATFYENYNRTSSGSYYNFAFALMAGIAIDVYDHTKLDIGYRFLDLGSIPGVSGKLTFNEVRAGLRYMIDN